MPPVTTTLAATAITSSTATLSGSVNPSGTSTDTLFQYSTDPTLAPHVVTTLAGTADLAGNSDGTGTAAGFNKPLGVAVDAAGNVYVADAFNNTIRKITLSGVVTTLAGTTAVAGGSADGTGAAARFNTPEGIAVDAFGNVFVADTFNYTIRKITPAGVVTTLAGKAGQQGVENGTGAGAQFGGPIGIAVDSAGNVYVADTNNETIREITPAGVVTTLAGGQQGNADGTGATAEFSSPEGLAVDGAGNVYVADTGNDTIRKITPAGVVTTLAGTAGRSGSSDGTGAAAEFHNPVGVAVDAAGNVYVGDALNNAIREISPTGVVTTLAGALQGSGDGTGAAAQFNTPIGVAVDGAGNVYVADKQNDTIREISNLMVLSQSGLTGADAIPIAAPLIGLQPGTTYYFRAVATNPVGTAVGTIQNFTTPTANAATTSTQLSVSPNPSTVGQSVTFTAIVTVPQGSGVATGMVTFLEGTSVVGAGTLNEADLATFSTSTLSVGTHTLIASFAGDVVFGASASNSVNVTIDAQTTTPAAIPTTTTLTTTPSPSLSGEPVVLTAVVTVAGGSPATGSVTFTVDGVAQPATGLSVINGSDVTTLTLDSLAKGNHVVTAAYGGSATFAASISPRSLLIVTGPVVPADGPLVTSFQRFGYHSQPTVLVLTFNEALDPSGANSEANYRIVPIGSGGTLGPAIAIKRIDYDSVAMTVTIHPSHRLNVHKRFELIVDGTSRHALTDLALDALDGRKTGKAGSDYIGTIDRATLAGPSLHGRKYVNFWIRHLEHQ